MRNGPILIDPPQIWFCPSPYTTPIEPKQDSYNQLRPQQNKKPIEPKQDSFNQLRSQQNKKPIEHKQDSYNQLRSQQCFRSGYVVLRFIQLFHVW
jgi:hypothetical protein